MAMDYKAVSEQIIDAVGGVGNITSATNCMTRLRLTLADDSKADDEKVKAIKGVKSVIKQGGQYQIVIGNEVSNLFKEFATHGNFTENSAAAAAKPTGNKVQQLFGFIAGCMTPMLPAMLGTGMVKVVLTLLTTFGLMSTTGSTYVILYGMADSFFYFLPIFLAVQIAKKTNHSIPLYMVIGAMLVYPDIITLLGGGTEGVQMGTFLGMSCTYLFGFIPVISSSYSSSVLPILLMTPVMGWAEDFADRVSPNMVKAFLKPMIFLLICTPVAFCVLGPLGNVIGNVLSGIFAAMYNAVPWLTVGILSAIMPFIVMTGMHYALIPLCMNNMATLGYDVIVLVTMFCSNLAQGGASLGVSAKSKDVETRSESLASGISAIVAGITEPAMYGINMRFMKPMIAACIAAGASGLWCGITGVKGYTMGGSPSILSLIQFIGGDSPMRGVIFGAIGAAISIGVSFVLTTVLWKEESGDAKASASSSKEKGAPAAMALETEAGVVNAPVNGKIIPAKDIPDAVFAEESMGPSIGIEPTEGVVYAPFDGQVVMIFPTNHAIGLKSDSGMEVLIHIGVDTVEMNGDGFKSFVAQDDKVKAGQKLITFDRKKVKAANHSDTVIVILTNGADYKEVKRAA